MSLATRSLQAISGSHLHTALRQVISSRKSCRQYITASPTVTKPPIYGQPLAKTHAHLIAPEELTPGIPKVEYEERRKNLMDSLPQGSLVVCLGGTIKYMSQEIFYKFRQASDFWYLTGFQEADAAVILEKTPTRTRSYKMTLFSSGKNAHREKWDGARTSFDDAVSIFAADEARDASYFYSYLKSILPLYDNYFLSPYPATHQTRRRRRRSLVEFINSGSSSSHTGSWLTLQEACDTLVEDMTINKIRDLRREVARLRTIKSPREQAVLRKAADVSALAHTKTMRFANMQDNTPESAIAAHFEYLCLLNGAARMAYVPVVASGANALIIHYTSNDNLVQPGDLVLVDAGCELNGYASDITRTYPTYPTGRFTTAQAELYNAVLVTLKHCTSLCTESSGMNLYDLHAESCRVLTRELNKLGFNLSENTSGPGNAAVERVLYPHFLSHPVGIDLHEAFMNRNSPLQTGMVITIEPGVYVPASSAYPKQYHNIGIRIEDEVLVQPNHPIVLSVDAPKEIVDVEAACQGQLGLGPY